MSKTAQGFSELLLSDPIVKAVTALGYESPLPVQAACIPPLLEGKDVMGLAQTGTGKTAAFALPLLSKVDLSNKSPQVLVLTPTRELAIQVAEAFQAYARFMPGFHVLPIYGGQRYAFQFSQLHRGPHVIVGTPGRIQDHLDRGTLNLSGIRCVVLDEADEMLRMGFVEAVEAILSKTPEKHQMALFSATMPPPIKRITKRYMTSPVELRIESKTVTAANVEQVYLVVANAAKFEALVRILEIESYDGILIFTRTRIATTELAERLLARGFDAAPLNGEMTQATRERIVKRFKSGKTDIMVATDVAARGLDVDRISLVINFDIPGDTEAYIHRIGRTGRVGRYGKAILFANPRETRWLKSIERGTRQPLTRMEMPSHDTITRKRVERFREKLLALMADEPMDFYKTLSFELMEEMSIDSVELAAGLLCMAQKDRPLRAENSRVLVEPGRPAAGPAKRERPAERPKSSQGMALYRVEVGSADGVEVRNILGAVANETNLHGRFIGQIRIRPKYSTIELPADLPRDIIEHLKTTQVGHKPLMISRTRGPESPPEEDSEAVPEMKPKKPKKPKKSKMAKAAKAAKTAKTAKARKVKAKKKAKPKQRRET